MAYGNGGAIAGGVGMLAPGDVVYMPKGVGASFENQSVPTRTPATQVETDRLQKAVEVLHLTLNELDARLTDVMVPDGPSNGLVGPKDQRPQSSVALARHLGQLADRVEQATARIKSLTERIEV